MTVRNVAASVRARLSNRAAERKENVQLALTRYAIERLLYRISISPHNRQFVLKGAMLFSVWTPMPYRASGDLDLLGYGNSAPEFVLGVFREICGVEAPDDGVTFKADTLRVEVARAEDEYSGVRLTMTADIAGALLPVQVDIGFGDAVTPGVQVIDYPSLLDMPLPKLQAYPPETVIAEKFQALVELGMLNSRMKDFFDIWAISETFSFDGRVLADAIGATFDRRSTALPKEMPIALTDEFSGSPAKQAQWQGFLRRTAIALAPAPFPELQHKVASFVMPPIQAIAIGDVFAQRWEAGGPWK